MPMSPSSYDPGRARRIEEAFHKTDVDGDGKLYFKELFSLLKKGDPDFLERDAEKLFRAADTDLSGALDFNEFLQYIFDHGRDDMIKPLWKDREGDTDDEVEAKRILLTLSYTARSATSSAVKARGGDWRKMTWRQRLEAVQRHEASAPELEVTPPQQRGGGAPRRGGAAARGGGGAGGGGSARQPAAAAAQSGSSGRWEEAASQPSPKSQSSPMRSPPGAGAGGMSLFDVSALRQQQSPPPASAARSNNADAGHPLARMSQKELVVHSLKDEDLAFACFDKEVYALRDHLKTCGDPLDFINVKKYLAKGTAGWVFLAEDKESGEPVAMKLLRMTQARTGLKEWYVSKLLSDANVSNVVFTYETVSVLERRNSPLVIREQLQSAGPVPHYLCLVQEFMNGGTLENLVFRGEMTPHTMFLALEDVASALSAMHAHRVCHRDVKPENVMLEMDGGQLAAAKLCDLGSAEIGSNAAGRADDIRRFGVTVFSVATGEPWTKRRLIRETHENLVARLSDVVRSSSDQALRRLPKVLEQILSGNHNMKQVAALMAELVALY